MGWLKTTKCHSEKVQQRQSLQQETSKVSIITTSSNNDLNNYDTNHRTSIDPIVPIKKDEEYIIEYLDMLQSQTGDTIHVNRRLALKILELAMLKGDSRHQAVATDCKPKSHLATKLDTIIEELQSINQRVQSIEQHYCLAPQKGVSRRSKNNAPLHWDDNNNFEE